MFGRKKRSASTSAAVRMPQQQAPATSTAATAAAQAFLRERASNTNLSAAAAAAALRSHASSPTPLDQIQTKRMQRRASNASQTSAIIGSGRPTSALGRTMSNGSMTERTFRPQSPVTRPRPDLSDAPPSPVVSTDSPMEKKRSVKRPASAAGNYSSPSARPISPDPVQSTPRQAGSRVRHNSAARQPTLPDVPEAPVPAIPAQHQQAAASASKPLKTRPMSAAGTREKETALKTSSVMSSGTLRGAASPASANRIARPPSVTAIHPPADLEAALTATAAPAKPKKKKVVTTTAPDSAKAAALSSAAAARAEIAPDSKPTTTPLTPAIANKAEGKPLSATPSKRVSASPGRAHFANKLSVDDAIKHEPPARAVSPAKSAMKPSSRATSPLPDASISEKVPSSTESKRRSVRVSFDSAPIVLSEMPRPASPTASVSGKTRSGFFGLGKKKVEEPPAAVEEKISPVPVLPSFGSVRMKQAPKSISTNKDGVEPAEQSPSTPIAEQFMKRRLSIDEVSLPKSPPRSRDGLEKPKVVVATDHSPVRPVVESQPEKAKEGVTVPAPVPIPEPMPTPTTSTKETVEAPVAAAEPAAIPTIHMENVEDDVPLKTKAEVDEHHPVQEKDKDADDAASTYSTDTLTPKHKDSAVAVPVPELAVLPATPDLSTERELHELHAPVQSTHIAAPLDSTPIASAEEIDREGASTPTQPHREVDKAPVTDGYDTGDETGDSVYDDAAEEPEYENEGDGFGSIAAIMTRPIVPIEPTSAKAKAKEVDAESILEPEPAADEGWEKAQAYWAGLSSQKKAQLEEQAVNTSESNGNGLGALAEDEEVAVQSAQPVKKQVVLPPEVPVSNSKMAQTPTPVKSSSTATPKKSALKKTMRPEASPAPAPVEEKKPVIKAKKTPQSTEPVRLRGSMRRGDSDVRPQSDIWAAPVSTPAASELRNASKKTPRPVSMAQQSTSPKRSVDIPSTPQSKSRGLAGLPGLRRTTSNGSDSSSSFKRARSVTSGGGMTMRRTMRGSVSDRPQSPETTTGGGRMSLRNASITSTDRKPFSGGASLRNSMRPSSVASFNRAKSPVRSIFSIGKGKQSASSRTLDDSDDEDFDPYYNSKARSRFADDSDEELRPVRGIPTRVDEGDSTDLEDDVPPVAANGKMSVLNGAAQPATTNTNTNTVGSALTAGSMRDTQPARQASLRKPTAEPKKKRGFFGILGRKKDSSRVGKLDVDSAARRDTPLERTSIERANITPINETPLSTPSGTPVKAVKPLFSRQGTGQSTSSARGNAMTNVADAPPVPKLDLTNPNLSPRDKEVLALANAKMREGVRPMTSDGTTMGRRPNLAPRVVSTGGKSVTVDGVSYGRNGKPKKFQMLRRALGIYD